VLLVTVVLIVVVTIRQLAAQRELLTVQGELKVAHDELAALATIHRDGSETDAEGAIQTAESVRAAVAQHRFGAAGGAHLTCSVGVACRPQDATDRDALLAAADHAMYVAKQLGRNQVIAAHDHIAAALVADTTHADREDQALLGTVEALAAIVNVRDRYTGQHSEHVAILSQHVALELGRDASEIHMIGLAARLHDIGKVAISDAILNKPGRLTIEEWRAIHEHPAIGADIAARIPLLRPASQLIRSHHERYDGTGYPDRLSGNEIPWAHGSSVQSMPTTP